MIIPSMRTGRKMENRLKPALFMARISLSEENRPYAMRAAVSVAKGAESVMKDGNE